MANTVAARKAKGRKLQMWVREQLLALFPELHDDDITSTPMGVTGADLQLSPAARKLFPFDVECKNQEAVNVWKAYEQAGNGKHIPLVIIKKNRHKPLAVLDALTLLKILENYARQRNKNTIK